MRYIGSKSSLVDQIAEISTQISPNGTFCDPFGGIGTVGSYMKQKGYKVISGDILTFPHYYQAALLEHRDAETFRKLLDELYLEDESDLELYLNDMQGTDGWIVEEYSAKRMFFTIGNGRKIQACYNRIQQWKKQKLLSTFEYEILISSLIQSFDKVANTAGTYYAYLKQYNRKARKEFRFRILPEVPGNELCKSYLMEAGDLVAKTKCEILYLDPPYNERDYQRYYHLPENIALGRKPAPKGVSGVCVQKERRSAYNRREYAFDAFQKLVSSAHTRGIIFHYTDDGLIDMKKAKNVLRERGKVEEFYCDSKGYSNGTATKKCRHHVIICQI